ncbi:MAG: hypothetical protein ACK4NP_03815 [Parvularculaceae bacterium]
MSDIIRSVVAQKLRAVRAKLLKVSKDYAAILAELYAIEAKFGADFRLLEMRAFYPLRGAARIEAKNYGGTLGGLRIAARLSVDQTAGEAILRTIESLEAHIAAGNAAIAVGAAPPKSD